MFFKGNDKVIGLDIGYDEVRAVELGQGQGRYKVVSAATAPVSRGGDGFVNSIENTIEGINQCLNSLNTSTSYVVSGLSGPEVVVRNFQFPTLDEEELQSAVELEASQVCPFEKDQSVIEYQVLEKDERQVRGILVSVKKSKLADRKNIIEESDASLVLMDIEGLALLNCLKECEKPLPDKTYFIIDIGANYTNLVVLYGGDIPVIRDVPLGRNQIIERMAAKTNRTAEDLRKVLFGNRVSDRSDPHIGEHLPEACRPLTTEIIDTIRFCENDSRAGEIEKIYLSGLFSTSNGFMDTLNENLPVRAVLWNPLEKMEYKESSSSGQLVRDYGCNLAVAAGLAMRTI